MDRKIGPIISNNLTHKIHENYKDKGLVVIGIPSDNFNQEPGSEKEIKEFLNARWVDTEKGRENPARFIARSLNLKKGTDLFNRVANAKDVNEIFNILSITCFAIENEYGIWRGAHKLSALLLI